MVRRVVACPLTESGQGVVEFALVVTVLFVILFGIAQVGSALHAYMTILQASREGARVGVVGGSDQDVVDAVASLCRGLIQESLTVDVSPTQSERTRGSALQVKVDYEYAVGEGLVARIVGSSLSLSAVSVMRVE